MTNNKISGRTGLLACCCRSQIANLSATHFNVSHPRTLEISKCGVLYQSNSRPMVTYSLRSRERKSSLYLLYISAIIIFLMGHDGHLAEAAVTRAPPYQGFDEALDGSRCEVREEIVQVREEHTNLPSDAFHTPSCVKVNRCSGCCDGDSSQCVPTATYTTQVQIFQSTYLSSSEPITLNFTHHESCECRSRDDTRPVCVQEACEEEETWSSEECRCIAQESLACDPQICGLGEQWNAEACRCESTCQKEHCPAGSNLDKRTCTCVARCPRQHCPHGIWNPVTCRCHCSPCRSRRIYPRRLTLAKDQACRCTCRQLKEIKKVCRNRAKFIDPKTCSCKNLRGR